MWDQHLPESIYVFICAINLLKTNILRVTSYGHIALSTWKISYDKIFTEKKDSSWDIHFFNLIWRQWKRSVTCGKSCIPSLYANMQRTSRFVICRASAALYASLLATR